MEYPPSEWERIMKIQDVFTSAYHDRLTWREAAEILKVDERTVRRWKNTIEQDSYQGLLDRGKRRPARCEKSDLFSSILQITVLKFMQIFPLSSAGATS